MKGVKHKLLAAGLVVILGALAVLVLKAHLPPDTRPVPDRCLTRMAQAGKATVQERLSASRQDGFASRKS